MICIDDERDRCRLRQTVTDRSTGTLSSVAAERDRRHSEKGLPNCLGFSVLPGVAKENMHHWLFLLEAGNKGVVYYELDSIYGVTPAFWEMYGYIDM